MHVTYNSFEFNLFGNVCTGEIGASYQFTYTSHKGYFLAPPLFFRRNTHTHTLKCIDQGKEMILRFCSNHFHSHDKNFRVSREPRMEFKTVFFIDSSKY